MQCHSDPSQAVQSISCSFRQSLRCAQIRIARGQPRNSLKPTLISSPLSSETLSSLNFSSWERIQERPGQWSVSGGDVLISTWRALTYFLPEAFIPKTSEYRRWYLQEMKRCHGLSHCCFKNLSDSGWSSPWTNYFGNEIVKMNGKLIMETASHIQKGWNRKRTMWKYTSFWAEYSTKKIRLFLGQRHTLSTWGTWWLQGDYPCT